MPSHRTARWATSPTIPPAWQTVCLMALFACGMVARAAQLRIDANWDLRNYHLYDAFALLHGKWAIDFAPAQIQSFHAPTLDLPFYVLTRHLRSVKLINMILALPHALAACLAFAVALRALDARTLAMRLVAAVATGIGVTGAATLPVLASTMSDMPAVCLVLGAILLAMPDRPVAGRHIALAGLLIGAACGLKLTLAYTGIAMAVALATRSLPGRRRAWDTALLAGGGAIGVAITGGWWYWRLWRRWGSPLFPYYNNVFHAPMVPPLSFEDHSFLPHHALQWLSYPVSMALHAQTLMTEMPTRDPRMLVGLLASLGLLLAPVLRGGQARPVARFLAVLFLVGYAVWEKQFSIYRYLSGLELLTGTMAALAVVELCARWRRSWAALPTLAALGATMLAWTMWPVWERGYPGATPIGVEMPAIAPDGLVLMLDPSPMSYLAVFQPASVRFVGANNNLLGLKPPAAYKPLHDLVQGMIDRQAGEIWGLNMPVATGEWGDIAMRSYHLHALSCRFIHSSVDGAVIRMCRLEKDAVSRPTSP